MTRSGPQSTDLDQLRRLVQERTADLQRVKAEYDNYRKRVRRDRLTVREIAAANVLKALLPVLDAVDRACANEPLTPGLKDVAGSLEEQLGSLGVTSFGEVGDPFDPACHDALTHHVSAAADGLVCSAILRPGYRLGEHLLRPASVEVTGPAPPASSAPAARRGGHESSARPVKPPLSPALRPASEPSVRSDAISDSRKRSPADDRGGQDQPKDGGGRDGGRAPDLPLTRFATHQGKEPKRRVVAT